MIRVTNWESDGFRATVRVAHGPNDSVVRITRRARQWTMMHGPLVALGPWDLDDWTLATEIIDNVVVSTFQFVHSGRPWTT